MSVYYGDLARKVQLCAAAVLLTGITLFSLNWLAHEVPIKDLRAEIVPNTLAYYAARAHFNVGTFIGEAFNSKNPLSQRGLGLLESEYKGMTVGFEVDWKWLEAAEGTTNFVGFDKFATFANANGFTLSYSHLLWPSNPLSYPSWVFPDLWDGACGTRTGAELEGILKNHIQSVIGHADSRVVVSWNVINEAFADDGTLRKDNCFYRLLGSGYIDDAFRYARAAAPNGTLILNEYFQSDADPGGINLAKVDGFFDFVKQAKARGVPMDVVGIQNHLISTSDNYFGPEYIAALQHILARARDAGVKLMITEMDVYQGRRTQDDVRRVYQETAAACLADVNCVWFNTWGLSDAQSWLHTFPIYQNPQPLLFDSDYDKKPAYFGVLDALKAAPARK